MLEYSNTLSVKEYCELRSAVGWQSIVEDQAEAGLKHTDYMISCRDGEKIVLEDVNFPIIVEQGVELGVYDFYPYQEEGTVLNYLKHAYSRSLSTVKMIVDSIVDLINGRYGVEAVSGPVGVTEVIVDAAQGGVFNLLYVVIVISINLGVFNLIPFPVLDGGRLVFLLVEAVRRKPVKKEVEGYVNFVGMMILFAFMAFVVVKDVLNIFGGS